MRPAPPKMKRICCGEGKLMERWAETWERVVEEIDKKTSAAFQAIRKLSFLVSSGLFVAVIGPQ